jgi:hypothetical protein
MGGICASSLRIAKITSEIDGIAIQIIVTLRQPPLTASIIRAV